MRQRSVAERLKIIAANCGWTVMGVKKTKAGKFEVSVAREVFGSPTAVTITVDESFSAGTFAGSLISHENLWEPFFAMISTGHGAIDARENGYLAGRP